MDEIIEILNEISEKEAWHDDEDFNPCESSGANYDDAYWGGHEAGKISLARQLLDIINSCHDDYG